MVDYRTGKEKYPVKEKESLTEAQKNLMEILRLWRKETADKTGYPPYLIFNNKQMLEIIKTLPSTKAMLLEINGFGEKKVSSYGEDIIKIIGDHKKKN